MFPKIGGVPPKSSIFNKVFHCFHHPFWGVSLFLGTPLSIHWACWITVEFWALTCDIWIYPCNKNIFNKHQLLFFLMNGGVSLVSPFLSFIFNKLTWIDCDSGHFEHFAHHCYHLAYITCLSIFDEDYDVHIQREEVCTRSSDCSWAHTKKILEGILVWAGLVDWICLKCHGILRWYPSGLRWPFFSREWRHTSKSL